MPGNIGGGDGQKIDRALMFQFVNSLGKRRIKAAAEHLLDPQHRPCSLRLALLVPKPLRPRWRSGPAWRRGI
jgi:hypothetical protein